ncbi:DUF2249 domain-containing protein [Angustibacter sp. Root456]|uniref:DUF2249 domain-containing protein n=1 Tax=Angustibacter sp. Root456 TaxID=1736539 RepID=UPI0006F9ED3E|nr:DUF2249 domain-containing protein [Angustibacter sp. Root456]KQX69362.1 hypothetical protein ASD06_16650 [Angustibacter sp. Root456]
MSLTTPEATQQHGQDDVVDAIRRHHEQLEQAVAAGALSVRDAADRLGDVAPARDALVLLLLQEVLPHAAAEESTLYDVAATLPRTELLVRAMVAEHRRLEGLVNELARARTSGAMAASAGAVRALFEAHLAKENDDLLPELVAHDVDLARLLEGMHEILGGGHDEPAAEGGCGCGGCGCGGGAEAAADAGLEVEADLDVRAMPPALRHEQIFAAVADLPPGGSFVLCNDHDPKPLRYQLDAERPGQITWDYLEEGPQVWRVRIGRTA